VSPTIPKRINDGGGVEPPVAYGTVQQQRRQSISLPGPAQRELPERSRERELPKKPVTDPPLLNLAASIDCQHGIPFAAGLAGHLCCGFRPQLPGPECIGQRWRHEGFGKDEL